MAIFTDIDQTATAHGFTLTATIKPDYDHGAPWDEEDGHGPVSEWTTRDKAPGEFVLNSDGRKHRYYDYAEACRIARRDGWGSLWPYTLQTVREHGAWIARAVPPRYGYGSDLPPLASARRKDINRAISDVYAMRRAQFPSARAYAANAARADYERLRGWCNDQWSYVGVVVTASRNGIELGHASLWGIESDAGDYLLETANEIAYDAITDACKAIAALGQPDSTLAMH